MATPHDLLSGPGQHWSQLKLHRARAGCYVGKDDVGRLVTVEYLKTAYGDSGWVWWIDSERSDYPVDTKRYCVELLIDALAHTFYVTGEPSAPVEA